jgi:hypothetical protein
LVKLLLAMATPTEGESVPNVKTSVLVCDRSDMMSR